MSLEQAKPNDGVIKQILDLARWAPSGDNEQPWQFAIGDGAVVVYCADTRDHVVYDLDGRPSQIAFGALFETMAIAASAHQLEIDVRRRLDSQESRPVFDVTFLHRPELRPDPLIGSIEKRSVQRRPMRMRPLSAQEKAALRSAVPANYEILWLESAGQRFKAARLMFNNARLRLIMPEAYEVHRAIIEWNAKFSISRVPDQALGVDPLTLKLMRWAMKSWERLAMTNKIMGTWAPRLQMDFVPGIACAAHFVIQSSTSLHGIDDYVAAGRAVQRFWLTLTSLGLVMQPEMTPLIFSAYIKNDIQFTKSAPLYPLARKLRQQLAETIGERPGQAVFMGRVGAGRPAAARSLRQPLDQLLRQ